MEKRLTEKRIRALTQYCSIMVFLLALSNDFYRLKRNLKKQICSNIQANRGHDNLALEGGASEKRN